MAQKIRESTVAVVSSVSWDDMHMAFTNDVTYKHENGQAQTQTFPEGNSCNTTQKNSKTKQKQNSNNKGTMIEHQICKYKVSSIK